MKKRDRKFKCPLCGRPVDGDKACCGEPAVAAGGLHIEAPMEPWICPTCGAQSDLPVTCCGKPAVCNPRFNASK